MEGRHAACDLRDGDCPTIPQARGSKLSGWLYLSNEYHNPTNQHLYLPPLSFPPHGHFHSMPNYDDENDPLKSSKKFSSIRFRRSGISSKRRSELKAAISGPHTFDGGGVSTTALGEAPLQTLNGTRSLYSNSTSTVLNGSSPPPQTFARGIRRNSDIPLRRRHPSLAWLSNRPAITPIHGPPHQPPRTTHKKPRKAAISKPLALDSPRFSSTPGISRKGSRRSAQINRGSRWSEIRGSNLPDVPSDEFDPRTMVESFPALNLSTSTASFGSVKQRTGKIDRALRASRTMLLPVPQEKAKPDLVYTDDSDAFSSPPSTPSTPVWETTAAPSMLKTDPKLANRLKLADVHAQIQAMIDSANRPLSTETGDYLGHDQEPSNNQRNDIPLSLRPGNPTYGSFPQLTATHRRSASSPPLGSSTYHAYRSEVGDRLYRPITPVMPHQPVPPTSPPPKTIPTSPTSTISADLMTPTTPTKKPSSECSDSPSVYSQLSSSPQIGDVTPTSSNASSPDRPYAKSKHERLLAAISEGISSPTKPGSTAPSILGSGHGRTDRADLANPPLDTDSPAVPVIVVTDPNDDDLVYSESSFSIVDMYTGSVESLGAGLRRRRTRTADPVSPASPSSIEHVLTILQCQPRHALDTPRLKNSVSFDSPRLSQVAGERPSSSQEPPKRRASIFRPGLPSSFLSMSTLHEAEIAGATNTLRDRKSFYAAVGLKGLFRRSSSKGSLFGQAQANGAADAIGGGGGTRPGSTSLAGPSSEGGDNTLKGGWGLFKWKR